MYRTNRPQRYYTTNRLFGPYLPPYPLQGVGLGTTCDVANANLQVSQSAFDAVAKACSEGSSDDCVNLPNVEATLNSAKADVSSCTTPTPLVTPPNDVIPVAPDVIPPGPSPEPPGPGPSPNPPGPSPKPPGPGPSPNPPGPGPSPKPPEPSPEPDKTKSETNWLLWGSVAVAGVLVLALVSNKKKK